MSDVYDILSIICDEVSTAVFTSESPHFKPNIQDFVDKTKAEIQNYYATHPHDSPQEQLQVLEKLLENTYTFAKSLNKTAHLYPPPALWAVGSILITSTLIAKRFFKNEVLKCPKTRLAYPYFDNLQLLDQFLDKLQELYKISEYTKLGIELLPVTFCNSVLQYYTHAQNVDSELEHHVKSNHLDSVPSEKLLLIVITVKFQLMNLENL